jgi:hypothetical protein
MPPAKIILVLTCKRMIADWSFFFFRGARAKAKAHTQKDKEKEKKEERQASGGFPIILFATASGRPLRVVGSNGASVVI